MAFSRRFAWKLTFGQQRARSLLAVRLAIGSIVLCVAVMEIAISVVDGFGGAIREKLVGFVADIELTTYFPEANAEKAPIAMTPALRARLQAQTPHFRRISPFINYEGLLKSPDFHEGVRIKGVPQFEEGFYQDALVAGTVPNLAPAKGRFSKDVLISQTLANRLELAVGDKGRLIFFQNGRGRLRQVTISGLYDTDLAQFDRNYVFADIRLVRSLLRKRNPKVVALENQLDSLQQKRRSDWRATISRAQLDSLQTQIDSLPPTVRWNPADVEGYDIFLQQANSFELIEATTAINRMTPQGWKAYSIEERFPQLFDWINLQHQNVQFILILMGIVAVVNLSTAVLMMITERTLTIGLLNALGAVQSQIRGVFVWQAFYLITIGVLLGNVLALGLLALQSATGLVALDPESYYVEQVPVAWPWLKFLVINIGVIVACTLAMLLPAGFVARISPVKALRF